MNNNCFVSLPLEDLLALQTSLSDIHHLRDDLHVLNLRVDKLHRTLFDMMQIVNELKKGCQP